MKKYFIIIGVIVTTTLQAQTNGHCLNANIGGGLHGLRYTLNDGDVKSRLGGTFSLGYSYFLNSGWGFGAGIGLQTAGAEGVLSFTSASPAVDSDGDNFELRTHFNSWTERQKALFLDIPAGVQYQYWFNGRNGLLTTAGAMVSLPVRSSYKVISGAITTTGYYEQWNVELRDLPQHGFATTTERPSGDLALNTSYSLFADLGWLYRMSDRYDLYAGGYISYSLNSVCNASAGNSDYPSGVVYESMITNNGPGKVNVLTVGLKAGVRLHLGKKNRISAKSVVPVEESAPVVIEEPVQQQVVQTMAEVEPVVQEDKYSEVQPEPETTTVNEPVVSPGDAIVDAQALADRIKLRFPVNSAVPLNDEFDEIFMELAAILKANPGMKVIIQGHTCNLSGRDYNLKISENRAEVGRAKLMKQGVPASQIIIESKAFDEPLVPNTNEENRSQNRRIRLIIKQD